MASWIFFSLHLPLQGAAKNLDGSSFSFAEVVAFASGAEVHPQVRCTSTLSLGLKDFGSLEPMPKCDICGGTDRR